MPCWNGPEGISPKFGSFFTGMSAKRSGDATLRDATRALALLSTDAAAVKGLQAVVKKYGFDGVDFDLEHRNGDYVLCGQLVAKVIKGLRREATRKMLVSDSVRDAVVLVVLV